MKSVQILLCALSTIALMNLRGEESFSDIQSMLGVLDSAETSLSHRFSLTGTVHSVEESNFVIDDGKRLLPIINRCEHRVSLESGNRIFVKGIFGLKKVAYGNEPYTVAHETQILDLGTPPLPAPRTLRDLSNSRDNLRLVQTTGTIIDCRNDEADSNYLHLILKDGPITMPISIFSPDLNSVNTLIDAKVSVIGTFNRTLQGVRRYSKPAIISSLQNIKVIAPPPPQETIPMLERKIYLTPKDILSLGKRKICGEVIAVWQRHNLLVRDDDNRVVRIRLSKRNRLMPKAGQRTTICGYPETDQFNITLGSAMVSSRAIEAHVSDSNDTICSPSNLISQTSSELITFNPSYYGKLITLIGTVGSLISPDNAEGRIGLACDGRLIYLDASSCPEALDKLRLGCTIKATGICLFEMNDYDAQTDTPHVSGMTIVLRGKGDVVIVAHPPWLTPMRFLIILSAMATIIVLVLIWNISLRILVERRGRELARKQAEALKARLKATERTRLATELHDAVVQNLTGAALEIRAAIASLHETAAEASPHMDIALKTINASRAELRNCIWDLRNLALEEKEVDEAIRIALQPHLGNTELQARFNVSRRKIPDHELHHIISIIRELTINAIRHGHAKTIRVAGTLDRGRILFSVTDDGVGFDPSNAPGMEQGHFGIEGVMERTKTLNGTATFTSAPGKGTRVSVSVELLEEVGQ